MESLEDRRSGAQILWYVRRIRAQEDRFKRMSEGCSCWRSDSETYLEECRSGDQILNVSSDFLFRRPEDEECLKDCRAWGSQMLTELAGLKKPGGPAKEETSHVWGGSGAGAELRLELQSGECLGDSGHGDQILRHAL